MEKFREKLSRVYKSLDETGAKILGVVLNDLPQKKTPGYYYSGYYGYGYFRYKYYNKYYGRDSTEDNVITQTEKKERTA